jgi:hypothetical protein
MEGDSVEEYYKTISRWFHDVLIKESIPIEIIESAEIIITPDGGKLCRIVAEGREFESFSKQRSRRLKEKQKS